MKNMKKLVSLLLAVCLMASLAIGASAAEPTTVDVSGGTGTSSVSLSSTSDGTLDGDPAATKMNVVIPTILPIAVGTDGTVTTATDMKLLLLNFLEAGKSVITLDVEHEQWELCQALGGCFADIIEGTYKINLLEPRCWDTDADPYP